MRKRDERFCKIIEVFRKEEEAKRSYVWEVTFGGRKEEIEGRRGRSERNYNCFGIGERS